MHALARPSFRSITLILVSLAVLLPARAQQPKPPAAPVVSFAPGFTVEITYSPKALSTLKASKETVIVVDYLYGFPKQGTPKRDIDEIGQVDLGEVKREVAPGAPAVFDRVTPDQPLLKWIDSQGLQLLINVYSGRKSSQNNLIDCGLYEGPIKSVQGKTIPISCKLIAE